MAEDERPVRARTPDEFRGWLRDIRERAGFSQETLAAMIGTDRRNLHRWERAGHDPGGLMLLQILDAVGQRIEPSPPEGIPRPISVELRSLADRVEEIIGFAERSIANQSAMLERQGAILERITRLLEGLGVPVGDDQTDPNVVRRALAQAMAPALETALESSIVRRLGHPDSDAPPAPARSTRRARSR